MYDIHRCPVSSARSTQKVRRNNNNNNMRRWNRVTSTYDASINCSSSQPFLALPMRANTLDRSHHFESGALLNRRHYHDVWYICTPAVLVQWAMTHYSDKMNMSWPIFARHWLQHWDRASGLASMPACLTFSSSYLPTWLILGDGCLTAVVHAVHIVCEV